MWLSTPCATYSRLDRGIKFDTSTNGSSFAIVNRHSITHAGTHRPKGEPLSDLAKSHDKMNFALVNYFIENRRDENLLPGFRPKKRPLTTSGSISEQEPTEKRQLAPERHEKTAGASSSSTPPSDIDWEFNWW